MVSKWNAANGIKQILILFLFFLLPAESYLSGQDFRYLRPADGLDASEVNSIVQDKEGILWLGTETGVISYNGLDFNNYRPELGNPGSLPERRVRTLFIDSDNNLWVATSRNLSRYLRDTDSFVIYPSGDGHNGITDIITLAQYGENLLIHTREGLYLLPLEKKNDPGFRPQRIELFRSGHPASGNFSRLFSFESKLYLVDNETKPGSALILQAALDETTPPRLNTQSLAELENINVNFIEFSLSRNMLYFGTSNGVHQYSPHENRFVQPVLFSDCDIRAMKFTSTHRLYLSCATPELLYMDLNTGVKGGYAHNPLVPGSLISNRILCLFEDFSGNLWAGHQGQGVSIKSLYRKEFQNFTHDPQNKNSLSSPNVTAIKGYRDLVFVGLRSGGISYMQQGRDPVNFTEVKLKQNNELTSFTHTVWDILDIPGSRFWVGSDIGLLEMYNEDGIWVLKQFSDVFPLNRPVRRLLADDNNNLWCGVIDEGLLVIPDPSQNTEGIHYWYKADASDPESLSDNTITSMMIDSRRRFWIGTLNGLNLITGPVSDLTGAEAAQQLKFNRFIARSGNFLNNNEINFIYENADGNIWIATQGGGINILDFETGKFTHITTENGLPSNDVMGILPDEMGNLWISTKNGLAVYRQAAADPLFYYYGREDGLQGNRFTAASCFKSAGGEMFFGGETGLTKFFPGHIRPNQIEPKIVFTGLNFGNEPAGIGEVLFGRRILEHHINETERITLPHYHRVFSIGTAAVHYQYPFGNKIRYRLHGYDQEWRTIPNYHRGIYYSNLPPGKYTLEAKAVNSNNIGSSESRILAIHVLKPWYRMWYSKLIIAILIICATGGVGYIFFNRQKMLFQGRIDKIAIENTESKMALLTDIAHGIKTPLSLVIAPLDDLMKNRQGLDPEVEERLLLIRRNARYLSKLTNQIIDFSKVPTGKLKPVMKPTDIAELVKGVVLNFSSLEQSRSVRITTELHAESLIIDIDREKIEEVLYNIISNAFKHTPENHNIIVTLEELPHTPASEKANCGVKISVFNEGEPLPERYKDKIFERFYKINEKTEGTGIGLAFSKTLVEMHGGTITVTPISGRGTEFTITLPCGRPYEDIIVQEADGQLTNKANEVIPPAHATENKYAEPPDRQLKIVLVEDNSELRRFLGGVLSRDYKCYQAADGLEGLQLINKLVPDIVISDVIMPGKDGYQLCREVKENNRTCHIPVILLTAKNSPENFIAGYETGADAYVSKPFDLEIISSQISRLIKNRELIRKKYREQNFMVEVSETTSRDDVFLQTFTTLLEKNLTDPEFNVTTMAENLDVSPTQLYRKIRALTGHSPVEFIKILKLNKSYELLLDRKNSVKEVCYLSGFNNISYFIKCFRNHFGVTPAHLREKGDPSGSPAERTGVSLSGL
jgi:signal transduction histidine kinase/DNA-binding response OmpR family regulator/ligand-binding sensor domain-containing protein